MPGRSLQPINSQNCERPLSMILSCPTCSARFNVEAEALGTKGRMVKCAKCAHKWHAMPEGVVIPVPVPSQHPATETVSQTPQPEAKNIPLPPTPPDGLTDGIPDKDDNQGIVKNRSTLKWWITLAAIIVVLSSASVIWRKSIVALYPSANDLFMMIKLPVDTLGDGLVIHTPETGLRLDGKDRVLTIQGQIENTTGRIVDVPYLRATLRDTSGHELQIWTFLADEPRVSRGERVNYETKIHNPAQGATGLDITFIRQDEVKIPKTK